MGMFDITGLGGVTDVLKDLIQLFPNAEQRAAAASKIQDTELAIAQGQMATNTAEASNGSLLVSGWRPATGWLCVAGFAYNMIATPLHLPSTSSDVLQTMLFGMLGLGGMRTVEKVKGVASGRK